jgi:hypothetical protein
MMVKFVLFHIITEFQHDNLLIHRFKSKSHKYILRVDLYKDCLSFTASDYPLVSSIFILNLTWGDRYKALQC